MICVPIHHENRAAHRSPPTSSLKDLSPLPLSPLPMPHKPYSPVSAQAVIASYFCQLVCALLPFSFGDEILSFLLLLDWLRWRDVS